MGQHVTDKDDLILKKDFNDQAILVPADVNHGQEVNLIVLGQASFISAKLVHSALLASLYHRVKAPALSV